MTALPPDGGAQTEQAVQNLRRRLSAADLDWLPEIPRLKHPGREWGNWRDLLGTFDPEIVYRNRFGALLNTALYLNGLICFDFDVDDPDTMAGLRDVQRDILGPALCARSRPYSSRTAALYRLEEPDTLFRSLKGIDGTIEVFHGPKDKLTAFGEHLDKTTQMVTRLQWHEVPGNISKADLPVITVVQREAFLKEATPWLGDEVTSKTRDRSIQHSTGPAQAELPALIEALRSIPNKGFGEWSDWNRIGMALYAASAGDKSVLDAWIAWTKQAGWRNAAQQCRDRWDKFRNCPPTNIGAGTIFHHAQKHGYRRSVEDIMSWRNQQTQARRLNEWKPTI